MRLFYNTNLVLFVFILTLNGQNGDGDNGGFELGAALYRGGAFTHGHTGIFMYFSIDNGIAHLYAVEQSGSGSSGSSGSDGLHILHRQLAIEPSLDAIATIKEGLRSDFTGDNSYYGIYSIPF